MTKAAMTSARRVRRPGMSVRATAQAMGTANTRHSATTAAPATTLAASATSSGLWYVHALDPNAPPINFETMWTCPGFSPNEWQNTSRSMSTERVVS